MHGMHRASAMTEGWAYLAGLAVLLSLAHAAQSYEIKAVTKPVIMSESPYWDDKTNTVIFVDVIGKLVLRYDPSHPDDLKNISFSGQSGRVTPAVPVRGSSEILVGVGRTVHIVDVDWGAPGQAPVIRTVRAMQEVETHLPGNRFNDGKADCRGRLWIGTMDDSQTSRRRRRSVNKGELFRFDLQHNSAQARDMNLDAMPIVKDGLQIPNGMAWTADDKVYYLADSATKAIYRFDFNVDTGVVSNKTTAFSFVDNKVPGAPDGMTLDVEGNLWIACVHGGRVIRVDPRTGKLLQTILMNVTNPSAAEWGGPNRDVLYVTSARYKMDARQLEREPDAGSLFAITGLGTRGLAERPYDVVAFNASGSSRASSISCWTHWGLVMLMILNAIPPKSSSSR
ncbi:Regucalcin [Frankliniella fusca]|uniref:Regucalcin n=1 Tax=Frankliniella fusca TaxID=407009 RepID=A0AAE1HRS6_9NEOP|nr:Regucalcin [Frankliniella fusca]